MQKTKIICFYRSLEFPTVGCYIWGLFELTSIFSLR